MKIGRTLEVQPFHTYVIGILNVTPDSFSDGGKYNEIDAALKRAEAMIREGAEIIDIGGESTRPGSTPVPEDQEMERVIPVIHRIRENFDIPISLDTSKSEVAREGIQAGADIINDIWGLRNDPRMPGIVADAGVTCILMHNGSMYAPEAPEGIHLQGGAELTLLLDELSESVRLAGEAGIAEDKIIVDPGIGFGKNTAENLLILKHMEQIHALGYPVLLGCSRKTIIGETLDLPVEERMEGTLATSVLAVMKGVQFVRVHDVAANVRAVRMTEAILAAGSGR